ncbi:gamma-glutamylcyclotransferase family protein [Halorubrum sp. AD140]|uniref:gamma-glutamylcyclotransferase family protein n=1 Tax=Halorubrum sp. AD140 TaxID=3050073 RepID=UPI002ACC3A7F|nr:gamma-glutamylcyclotransferase family protein [Halorubrum sp. AD140]MDZ5812136.1 gamma-glutamylcyclotransferase family protein [Halorubrum sp. AD140]
MDVFVYGTLTEPERVAEVLDSFVFVGPATLTGLRLVEGRYPTLAPGGETAGRLLRTDETAALDAYERVDDGLYRRVSVPLDAPEAYPDKAAVYVGDPDRLDADATWPPGRGPRNRAGVAERDRVGDAASDEGFAERVTAYLERTDVRVRLTPDDPV